MHLMRVHWFMLRYVAEVHDRSHSAVNHEVILASRVHHKLWLSGWCVESLVAGAFRGVVGFSDVLDGMLLDMRVFHLFDVRYVHHIRVARHHGAMRHNLFSMHCSNRPSSEASEACWRNASAEPPHRSHPEVLLKLRATTNSDTLPCACIRLNRSAAG